MFRASILRWHTTHAYQSTGAAAAAIANKKFQHKGQITAAHIEVGEAPPGKQEQMDEMMHIQQKQQEEEEQGKYAKALEYWEFEPTPEHKSLVLLLYRSLLKELIKLPSVRKRTFTTYVRLVSRRRALATEKLLVDECIEEARRGIYILSKHNAMKATGEYKLDDMFLPQDTGQDVANYMENVYDPAVAQRDLASQEDVIPGQEAQHGGTLRGGQYARDKKQRDEMRESLNRPLVEEQDMKLRPPPPPKF